MAKPKDVLAVAKALDELTPRNADEKGIYGVAVGACYGLARAASLGYTNRRALGEKLHYKQELAGVSWLRPVFPASARSV